MKIQKKKFFWGGGRGGGGGGGGGSVGRGRARGQGGCERRIEGFVKIQKKILGGGGVGKSVGGGSGGQWGGRSGSGWGVRVDVNEELKFL